jgi:hypothetical protein
VPSGRRRTPPEPVFFLDRGLGRYTVAAAIRSRGFHVLAMFEVYPHGEDQRVGDDEWIARASDENWIALTKDDSIRRDHPDALATSRLRVFALNNANLTGDEMAERYLRHLNRIVQRAASPGPYVYVVSATGLELRWRPQPHQ